MENKKIDLIYDGIILQNGAFNTNSRSGIYFAAMNIFKGLLKRDDFNVKVYISGKYLPNLKLALEKDFKGYDVDIVSDIPLDFIAKIYYFLMEIRTAAKNKNQKIRKFILDIILTPFKLYYRMWLKLNKNKIYELEDKFDAYFSPANKMPSAFESMKKIKKFTMLYDAVPYLFPELSKDYTSGGWFKELLDSINTDDYYFCDSENTRQDFLKILPSIDKNKIHTVLLACHDGFRHVEEEKIEQTKKKYNIPLDKKYIFSLCTIDPRKNLVRALKTYIEFIKKHNIDDLYFVLGGGHFKSFIKEFEKEVSNFGEYKDKILKIGYVDDDDLAPLYSGAHFFVYTSQYEGFGLPPLEAMSCGCPVITSNNSSLPEVVGDAGIMIDWDNDAQHVEAYEKYYFNPELRKENIKKGLERSKQFSWEKCTNTIADIIKEAVEK